MSHVRPPGKRARTDGSREPIDPRLFMLVLLGCVGLIGSGVMAFDTGLNLRNLATGIPLILLGLGIAIFFGLYLARPRKGRDGRR